MIRPLTYPACRWPSRRSDGAWRTDERWHPLTQLPADFRWWRRQLEADDIVEFQVTDDGAAVLTTVVLADGRRVGLRSTDVARCRVVTVERVPDDPWEVLVQIPRPTVLVDVLTNLPPYQLIHWTPLTEPGDITPPEVEADDRKHRRGAEHEARFHTEARATVFPPSQRDVGYELDRVRYGR